LDYIFDSNGAAFAESFSIRSEQQTSHDCVAKTEFDPNRTLREM